MSSEKPRTHKQLSLTPKEKALPALDPGPRDCKTKGRTYIIPKIRLPQYNGLGQINHSPRFSWVNAAGLRSCACPGRESPGTPITIRSLYWLRWGWGI